MKIQSAVKFVTSIIVLLTTSIFANSGNTKSGEIPDNINDIIVKDINGKEVKLSEFKGKVLLIVNVASKCGYTVQYEGLQKIYKKYNPQGFEILAFPCNDFGGQEPGTNEEIKEFCSTNYSVSFPLFDKVKVIGKDKSPLYERLINNTDDKGDIKWNFEKFLIDKDGKIVNRYRSKIKPESEEIIKAIEELLPSK